MSFRAVLYKSDGSVHLTFTAPGDDETEGRASHYEIRSTSTSTGFERFRADFEEGTIVPTNHYQTGTAYRYVLKTHFYCVNYTTPIDNDCHDRMNTFFLK